MLPNHVMDFLARLQSRLSMPVGTTAAPVRNSLRYRPPLKLKAKFESGSSQFSFKAETRRAFNSDAINLQRPTGMPCNMKISVASISASLAGWADVLSLETTTPAADTGTAAGAADTGTVTAAADAGAAAAGVDVGWMGSVVGGVAAGADAVRLCNMLMICDCEAMI